MSDRQPTGEEALRQTCLGSGIRELEIRDWTCFSCGGKLIQAHEGDYFHDDAEGECAEVIPVPTSLVQPSLQDKAPSGARRRD